MPEFSLVVRAEILKRIVAAVTTIVEEARMEFSPDGMRITAIAPSNVMLVSINTQSSDFETFKVEDTFEVGLDFSRLADFLKALDKSENITVRFEDSKVRFAGDTIRYSLNAIDPSVLRRPKKLPELQFSAKVEMPPADFAKAIAICEKFSDVVRLKVEADTFILQAEGDVDDLSFEFDSTHAMVDGEADSLFSLEYLRPVAKVISKFEHLEISLGVNIPVALKAVEPSVQFYIAPRIEEV